MTAFLVNDDRVELPVGYFLSDDELSDLIARLGACGFDVAEACSMISACVAAVGATPAERARAVVAWRERLADGRPPVRGWSGVETIEKVGKRTAAYQRALRSGGADPRDFTREAYAQRSGA